MHMLNGSVWCIFAIPGGCGSVRQGGGGGGAPPWTPPLHSSNALGGGAGLFPVALEHMGATASTTPAFPAPPPSPPVPPFPPPQTLLRLHQSPGLPQGQGMGGGGGNRSGSPSGADEPGESSRGGKGHMVDGRDSAWRNRAPGPHAHRNTARQAIDGLWTEARGQQKQSNDPGNNQHILNTPIIGRR